MNSDITITHKEIFSKENILTLEKAKQLIGHTIACTSVEYQMNKPHVTIMKVGRIITEWDWAAEQNSENWGDDFQTQQDYWKSYMSPEQIDEMKTRLLLIGANNESHFTAHTKYSNFYDEPTFTGSDADREIYFIEWPYSDNG